MTYKTDDFRGYLMDSVRFTNSSGNELYDNLKETVIYYTQERGIPAEITDATVKSGGLLMGSKIPMLVIHHPDPACKYYDIGVSVNGNIVDFPLLGKSAEIVKYNWHENLKSKGNFIQAALYKADMYKIEQEEAWEKEIIDCINMIFEP